MKAIKRDLLLPMLALAGVLSVPAWAGPPGWPHHHPRSSVQLGIHFGVPLGYPPPYAYYPYPPRVYVSPIVVAPPVYIEQPAVAAPAAPVLEAGYWYYCREAQAYYPDVKHCPGGWQQVAPRLAQ